MVAVLSENDKAHQQAEEVLNRAHQRYGVPLLSPVTFAICWYFIRKRVKNKELRQAAVDSLFRHYEYSTVNDEMVRVAQHSAFHDKEDALQYYSALYAGADMIITFNVHDFQPYSTLQVMHPAEFLLI